jgi:hydroxymethyl cephem carbamoyltransferase
MKVLAFKPGHDGTVAFVDDGDLVFSLEAEKDSFPRYSEMTAQVLVEAMTFASGPPDVVAMGGWHKVLPGGLEGSLGAGPLAVPYRGIDVTKPVAGKFFGADVLYHASTHERTHILGGVAMSPFDAEEPMAVLVWEGELGCFYRWSGPGRPIVAHPVMTEPGDRYAALFALAEPSFPEVGFPRTEHAGKLMALAGLADGRPPTEETSQIVDVLLDRRSVHPFDKRRFRHAALHDAGVGHAELHRAARLLTDRLFARFLHAARRDLPPGLPLVIVGGCGLNCEWNVLWRDCGHFRDIFVPPCANDTGSAIGAAVDAAVALGEPCELRWDVYRGAPFVSDVDPAGRAWEAEDLDMGRLASVIKDGAVVAWVQGRCEIGPRALGHRSLLASAHDPDMNATLNRIKQRESYRPVAPVCLEEDLGRCFDDDRPDPFMLTFRRVLDPGLLPAVTHADGTARVQSVGASAPVRLRDLLRATRELTGHGVLCNTSLNFNGRGFINRTSELMHYAETVGIDHVVIEDRWYRRSSHRPE